MIMKKRVMLFAFVCAGLLYAERKPIVEHERDNVKHADIVRWYTWGKTNEIYRNYVRCEGKLTYDIKIPETGWYVLEQQGMPQEWNRSVYVDDKMELERFVTYPPKKGRHRWLKETNIFLTEGDHTFSYERTGFPGAFPTKWRLLKSKDIMSETLRADIIQDVVRSTDDVKVKIRAGVKSKDMEYVFVAECLDRDEIIDIGSIKIPATEKPVEKILTFKIPKQGIWQIKLKDNGVIGLKSDVSARNLVVIDINAAPPGDSLKKTLVVDIDCVKEKPYVERDGATRIVNAPFGSYRESSGTAPDSVWGLDGFSYNFFLPDINHVYILEVTYPDDAFRSIGFWSNDAGTLPAQKRRVHIEGRVLTGGVETGGQYRNTNKMLTHEAFMYPTGTNLVLAVVNMNRGSFAAASRIRVYRVDGPLPSAAKGARRGRLAGGFFEENGRWKRHFGMGSQPNDKKCNEIENLRSMERWGDWNRYAGVNLMSPSVVAYGGVQYPSKVIDGYCVQTLNEMRMLALVAEKYSNTFIPHLTLHGDHSFDKRMGVSVVEKKLKYTNPDVLAWSKEGSTVIPWRQFSYNCLHPEVQNYVYNVIDEIVTMLDDTSSFGGVALRIPLSWQFSGMTGLNNGDYGYGDWTIKEFSKDTGIKVDQEILKRNGGVKIAPEKRYNARYKFLMSVEMRSTWLKWRNDRIKSFYRRLRDRLAKSGKNRELYFMWWPSSDTEDEMNECGIDPDYWRDEKGISFYGMQFLYGRRCFAPRDAMTKFNAIFDERVLKLSYAGNRTVGIYSDYYEPNDKNFQWSKFGGAPYTAFDALSPAGEYERQIYAYTLAQLDTGVYFNGGNGWIFGTPSVMEPFMREYLSLPMNRFELVKGLPNDPVCFRECETKEGRLFYAVNVIDETVVVKLDLDGRGDLVSAVDGKKTSKTFVLQPYGMKSFIIKKPFFGSPAKIVGAELKYNEKAKTRFKKIIDYLSKLKDDLMNRKTAFEIPTWLYSDITNSIDNAVSGYGEDRLMKVMASTTDPKIFYAYDLDGVYPDGAFLSSTSRIGGYPAESEKKPSLVFVGQAGGDPLEGAEKRNDVYFAEGANRIWSIFPAGGITQLREFDAQGRYLRSGILTVEDFHSYNSGSSRHGFIKSPVFAPFVPIVWTNDCLCLTSSQKHFKYDVNDNFRQLDNVFGEKIKAEQVRKNTKVKLKALKENYTSPSQLKVHGGMIYLHDRKMIWKINPATLSRELVADLSKDIHSKAKINAFDVTSAGDIVVLSEAVIKNPAVKHIKVTKKSCPFVITDVLVNDDGSYYRRAGVWDKLNFAKVSPGGEETPVWDFSYRDFRQSNRHCIHRGKDGVIYVAGGGSRRVAAYRKDGTRIWERKWEPAQAECFGNLPWRSPAACCTDEKGRLWVLDTEANHIVALDAKTGTFLGLYGHTDTIDGKKGEGFLNPSGLAVVGNNLFVLDAGNLRLLKYEIK